MATSPNSLTRPVFYFCGWAAALAVLFPVYYYAISVMLWSSMNLPWFVLGGTTMSYTAALQMMGGVLPTPVSDYPAVGLFLLCGFGGALLVPRFGPWRAGYAALTGHLALFLCYVLWSLPAIDRIFHFATDFAPVLVVNSGIYFLLVSAARLARARGSDTISGGTN